jgi:steroid delta-isomerase-like uncharacterized protein
MKKILPLLFPLALLVSCQQPAPETGKDNEALVKQYFELFNTHQWAGMAALYSETAEFKDPSLGAGTVRQTRQQIIEKYSGLSEAFPDVKDEVLQIYPSGNRHVIVEFISKGTAPDGASFELPICTIFTIENGQITGDYTYYDDFGEQESQETP